MPVYTCAVLQLPIDASNWQAIHTLLDNWRRAIDYPPLEWDLGKGNSPLDELHTYGKYDLYTGGLYRCICISVGRSQVFLSLPQQWRRFLEEPATQDQVRHLITPLAALLQTEQVIYFPDSQFKVNEITDLIYSGQPVSLQTLLAQLNTQFGPPAARIGDILTFDPNGCWEGDGYYVDT